MLHIEINRNLTGGKIDEKDSIWHSLDFVWVQHGLYFFSGTVGSYAANISGSSICWIDFFNFWILREGEITSNLSIEKTK